MALQAYGLKTHIWNNNLRCIILLCLFPVLLLAMAFAGLLLFQSFAGSGNIADGLAYAATAMPATAPAVLLGSAAWFGVAFMGHQAMINAATKARPVTRKEEQRAYNLLENLCISRGITMPGLQVIETDVMNAFASGISTKNYRITLTRGIMNGLNDQELEAVIAHELSHVKNNDVRLLIIAVIFVGIFSFFGEFMVRSMFRTNLTRSATHRRSGGGQAGALIFIAFAIVAVAYALAILIRFSLSRKREYMADAGSVELTKNPDAMISALQKISGRANLENVPAEIKEMALENPRVGFGGMFATHPPIEKRIEALIKFAGGRDYVPPPPKRDVPKSPAGTGQSKRPGRNPWSRRP
ncbi:M48 family metallopeptidase [Robiginitomaculum antarcticum]|uniref:M48 family metallopeptidase n=1 Tax=Robiginitomaculum antarcticum TaxID=437507 RepID=UPI0003658129|nr:M48 family metallopeptidase [Robiginitomaculum antarcticum]